MHNHFIKRTRKDQAAAIKFYYKVSRLEHAVRYALHAITLKHKNDTQGEKNLG